MPPTGRIQRGLRRHAGSGPSATERNGRASSSGLYHGNAMKMFDVVASLQDFPQQHVVKGQVGTVVEELDNDHVLVEFADVNGVAYAIATVPMGQLMKLKHAPA